MKGRLYIGDPNETILYVCFDKDQEEAIEDILHDERLQPLITDVFSDSTIQEGAINYMITFNDAYGSFLFGYLTREDEEDSDL